MSKDSDELGLFIADNQAKIGYAEQAIEFALKHLHQDELYDFLDAWHDGSVATRICYKDYRTWLQQQPKFTPTHIWRPTHRHAKGGLYEVLHQKARDEADWNGPRYVIYMNSEQEVVLRKSDMFFDGRFVRIDPTFVKEE